MTYRDDLAAAQARADALQRRVAELEAENQALVRVRDRAVAPKPDVPKRSAVRVAAVGALVAGGGCAVASALVADSLLKLVFMMLGVACLPMAMSFAILATRYLKAGPDEALIITGNKRGPRVIAPGHGSFVAPFLEEAHLLDLRPAEVTGAVGDVRFTATVRVPRHEQGILRAAERFLRAEDEIPAVAGRLLESALRDALASTSIAEDRERATDQTIRLGSERVERLGLEIETLTLAPAAT